jgi:hypothetical protein
VISRTLTVLRLNRNEMKLDLEMRRSKCAATCACQASRHFRRTVHNVHLLPPDTISPKELLSRIINPWTFNLCKGLHYVGTLKFVGVGGGDITDGDRKSTGIPTEWVEFQSAQRYLFTCAWESISNGYMFWRGYVPSRHKYISNYIIFS